jgi:hypothetical protein
MIEKRRPKTPIRRRSIKANKKRKGNLQQM